MTEKQRNCFNVPAGEKKSWTSALTGTTTNYRDILQDYQPYYVTFQEFVTKQLTHFCLCGWWLMFGSSLQLGDCCLYPAAFQVNLLFPVNVAWQFLTWLAFCCLQQRFNHSHTGRGEWVGVDPVGFVEVLNVDKANNRQGTPVLLQKLVENYSLIMTLSFKNPQEKKKQHLSSQGLHFNGNRTKCTVRQTFTVSCWHLYLVAMTV